MGAKQSAQHPRGRDDPVAAQSRVRASQGEAKASQRQSAMFSSLPQNQPQNIIAFTSRLMRDRIENAYSFDFSVLRTETEGRVSKVLCRRSGRKAEVMVVRKHLSEPLQLEILKREVEIWMSLDHPRIARLLEVFEDDNAVYLVSECCPGGSLYDHLAVLQRYSEETARVWALQMTQALGYLQGHGLVHRNLRLDSWQLTTGGAAAAAAGAVPSLKLYGFSHCTHWRKRQGRLNAACGLLPYASPDVLLGRYTDACDMWSLGVIVYQLLCGRPPFVGPRQEVIRKILSGDVDMQTLEKAGVSDEAKSFVLQLLTISPHLLVFAYSSPVRRAALLTCAYCLNSDESGAAAEWFAAAVHSSKGCLTMEDLKRVLQREQAEPVVSEELDDVFKALDVGFTGEVSFTAFAAAMIGTLIEVDEPLIQRAFSKLDIDGDGILSLEDCRWAFGDPIQGRGFSAALSQDDFEEAFDYPRFAALVKEKARFVARRYPAPRPRVEEDVASGPSVSASHATSPQAGSKYSNAAKPKVSVVLKDTQQQQQQQQQQQLQQAHKLSHGVSEESDGSESSSNNSVTSMKLLPAAASSVAGKPTAAAASAAAAAEPSEPPSAAAAPADSPN